MMMNNDGGQFLVSCLSFEGLDHLCGEGSV